MKQELTSIRTLLSTATNTTPHDRLFKFPRSSITGTDLPSFLKAPGECILFKRMVRNKNDPLVDKVKLIETLSPYVAKIEHPNGKIDTVSTRHLAPAGLNPKDSEEEKILHDIDDEIQNTPTEENIKNENNIEVDNVIYLPRTTKSGRKVNQPIVFKA